MNDSALPDFELRAAEENRDEDVEGAPRNEVPAALTRAPAERFDSPRAGLVQSDASPGATWPIAAALLVGLALGFGGGYFVGGRGPFGSARDRPAPAEPALATVPAATPPAPTPGPAGREYTESAITEAPPAQVAAPPPVEPKVEVNASGRLLVRSTPANAQLFVDGRDRGRTPATIRNLARGAHRVRVVRDGYVAEERRIVITGQRSAQSMTISLERRRPASTASVTRIPAPQTPATVGTLSGPLDVESRPSGARVFLDGTLLGTTPFSSAQVPAGEHAIRLEYDGYRRWTSSVRIVSGERSRVRASLER